MIAANNVAERVTRMQNKILILISEYDLEKCKWLQKQAGNKFVDYLGNGMVMECYGVAGSCVKINNAKSRIVLF